MLKVKAAQSESLSQMIHKFECLSVFVFKFLFLLDQNSQCVTCRDIISLLAGNVWMCACECVSALNDLRVAPWTFGVCCFFSLFIDELERQNLIISLSLKLTSRFEWICVCHIFTLIFRFFRVWQQLIGDICSCVCLSFTYCTVMMCDVKYNQSKLQNLKRMYVKFSVGPEHFICNVYEGFFVSWWDDVSSLYMYK